MKKLFLLIALAISCNLNIVAQTTQPGHVVEYKGKAPKTPLKRAVQINVKGAGSTMSNATTGEFTLTFPNLKGGQLVFVNKPRAMGYELMNTREIDSWNINPNRSFNLVFCDKAQFDELCMKYYDISMKSYEDKLNKAKAMLDKALKAKEIQQQEYDEQTKLLEEDFAAKIANIDTYVDQFARIDLSEVSEKEQQILALVDEGKIDEAIAEYEKLDATSKLVEANKNISKLNEAQTKIQNAIDTQKTERDSIFAIFQREIDLLKLAGGLENYQRVGKMLYEYAMSDTTNLSALEKCQHFYQSQGNIDMVDKMANISLRYLKKQNRIDDQFFSTLMSLYIFHIGDEKALYYLNEMNNTLDIMKENDMEQYEYHKAVYFQMQGLYNEYVTHSLEATIDYYRKAVEQCEKIKNSQKYEEDVKYEMMRSLANLGSSLFFQKDYKEAEELLKKAIEEAEKVEFNDELTKVKFIQNIVYNLADVYNQTERYQEFMELCVKSCDTLEKYYKIDPLNVGTIYRNAIYEKGLAYCQLNDVDKAYDTFMESVEIAQFVYDHRAGVQERTNLKWSLCWLGGITFHKYEKDLDTAKKLAKDILDRVLVLDPTYTKEKQVESDYFYDYIYEYGLVQK